MKITWFHIGTSSNRLTLKGSWKPFGISSSLLPKSSFLLSLLSLDALESLSSCVGSLSNKGFWSNLRFPMSKDTMIAVKTRTELAAAKMVVVSFENTSEADPLGCTFLKKRLFDRWKRTIIDGRMGRKLVLQFVERILWQRILMRPHKHKQACGAEFIMHGGLHKQRLHNSRWCVTSTLCAYFEKILSDIVQSMDCTLRPSTTS